MFLFLWCQQYPGLRSHWFEFPSWRVQVVIVGFTLLIPIHSGVRSVGCLTGECTPGLKGEVSLQRVSSDLSLIKSLSLRTHKTGTCICDIGRNWLKYWRYLFILSNQEVISRNIQIWIFLWQFRLMFPNFLFSVLCHTYDSTKTSDLYFWLQKASYDNKTHLENSFSSLIKW